jgi:tetratricopeptide (TPR) repeat protein
MALFGRGMIRTHRGNYRKALEDLDAAAEVLPKYANVYDVRAKARRALGNEAGAKADEKKAQDLLNAGRGMRRGG